MKSLHISFSAILLSLAVAAATQSTVQKSFEQLKTLACRWQTTVEEKAQCDHVTVRVISMGHTFVFELKSADKHSD
jgi:hypothetical protein